jgi:hypothetical protein
MKNKKIWKITTSFVWDKDFKQRVLLIRPAREKFKTLDFPASLISKLSGKIKGDVRIIIENYYLKVIPIGWDVEDLNLIILKIINEELDNSGRCL